MTGNPNGCRKAGLRFSHSRLYNILFPMWLIYLLPTGLWLILLPANLVVDSLVLYLAIKRLHIQNGKMIWKQSIFRVWGIGFLCDLIGAALTLGIQFLIDAANLRWDTFLFPGATLLAIPGTALAGILIYVFDRRFAFTGCALNQEQIERLSLVIGIFTTPYPMLIPLYG